MSIEEFLDFMPHRVTLEALTGTALFPKKSHADPITVPARVVYEDVKTTDAAGQEVVARGKVYLGGVFGVKTTHRITLPDGTQPPIVHVLQYPDEGGAFYETVLFA
jgi:hypothetical protein